MAAAFISGMSVFTGVVRTVYPFGKRGRADAVGLPQYFIELIERCVEIGARDASFPVGVPATSISIRRWKLGT